MTDEDLEAELENLKEMCIRDSLRDAVQTGAGEARMLVVSEKYRVVYPKNFDDQADMSQIYSAFLNAATDDESVWEQDKILEETIEEKEYLCLLYTSILTKAQLPWTGWSRSRREASRSHQPLPPATGLFRKRRSPRQALWSTVSTSLIPQAT